MYKYKVMGREPACQYTASLLPERAGWDVLAREGAVFDRSTADLAEDLPSASLDYRVVEAHSLEPGDKFLIPGARGWLKGVVVSLT
jgi:hypothetical protein